VAFGFSFLSNNLKIKKIVDILQIVREQMARSLEKMREMEESLKLIPLLQVNII
jgi:hypothetical protein